MELQTSLKTFHFGDYRFNAFVPDSLALQQAFTKQLQTDPSTPAPYWARVWPSAYAICEFIATQPHWLQNKTVLELAAGLGLPSFLSAQLATKVTCSDYVPEAVQLMQQSIQENKLENINAMLIDWNHLPADLSVDVLLLSDINYEPQAFETLFNVIISFLEKGTTIILSTPQRLMAKPFIDRLLPYSKMYEEKTIIALTPAVACSVYVLQQ
ncbi:class I SAM-dependent methyltransferase [Lacibacter sp.]|uniref:class I SAM-dependent methyltransferase n=1 Tax=Lacibacter sp. TaxID=1915409 RepID=UPI002B4ACB6B|nr:methyltransferase domain-containing protein [Lacibacter sp.]HLP35309.1 methyltransferase domain-containing protein [Lacibacter sp.]